MKKIILSSVVALAMLGGCNNKQLTQQKDEAQKAREMAIKQAAMAKKAMEQAKRAERAALEQLEKAERAHRVAVVAAKQAKMAEVQCKAQNKLLQEKIARLEKQKK